MNSLKAHMVLIAALAVMPLGARAQAGVAAGGAGTGSAGQGAAANAHGAPQSGAADTAQAGAQPQTAAQVYAAGAVAGSDPRKAPASKPGALTLAEVLDQARAKNATLLAAAQNLRAVRAQELQAGVRQNPYLGLAGSDVTLPAEGASNPYSYSVQVSRLFERGGKRGLRLDNARATTQQTEAQLQDTIRQTVLMVKMAFTHMLIAKAALELSTASLKDFGHEVEIANDRYQAGDLGKLDYERLDLQLGGYESDEANDIITLRQASDQLQTLMGVGVPSAEFDIRGEVVPPVVAMTQGELVQSALDKRPDYAAARYGTTAAVANARLAVANGTADPTLEGEYDRSGTDNTAGFSINIPLRIFDRNQGNKDTAKFQADASRFTEMAARYQVISDVDQAWVGYTQAKRLADRFTEHYLDESRDVLSIAQFAFEHGGIALIDYLDALRDARSSTSDALNAYQQTWIAIHQLAAASETEIAP
jgi:cobalt-zinc-cadmium efflux system outer membrane protein